MRYRFGDTVLDTTRYQLRRGDEFVHVEPQVFDVLAHLVEHRVAEAVPHGPILTLDALSRAGCRR